MISAEQLARSFASILTAQIDADVMHMINASNFGRSDGCCASHDHCDSNIYMLEALTEAGLTFDPSDERQAALIDEAWTQARLAGFFLRTYVRTWGEGYRSADPDAVGTEAFCYANGYGEDDIARILAMAVAQTIDLTDPSGVHLVKRVS